MTWNVFTIMASKRWKKEVRKGNIHFRVWSLTSSCVEVDILDWVEQGNLTRTRTEPNRTEPNRYDDTTTSGPPSTLLSSDSGNLQSCPSMPPSVSFDLVHRDIPLFPWTLSLTRDKHVDECLCLTRNQHEKSCEATLSRSSLRMRVIRARKESFGLRLLIWLCPTSNAVDSPVLRLSCSGVSFVCAVFFSSPFP